MRKTGAFLAVLVLALAALAMVGLPVVRAQDFDGDRVVLGDNYVLSSGETLEGNLAVLGGTATIQPDAMVRGDVSVAGGVLTVDGTIDGNVNLFGGSVRLNETALVTGNLASFAGSVSRAPGSQVQGDTFSGLRTPSQIDPVPVIPDIVRAESGPRNWLTSFINWQLGTIGSILLMGLLGVVLVLIAPRAVGRVASATAMQPALTFGVGFLTLVLGTLAGAILLIACGLGLLIWLALLAAMVLGWIGVAAWVGQRLLGAMKLQTASSVGEVLAGVVLITLLSRLPWCFGGLFGLIFVSWGLGAVVVSRFGTQDPREDVRPPRSAVIGDPEVMAPLAPPSTSTDLEIRQEPIVPPTVDREDVPPAIVTEEPTEVDDLGVVVLPEVPASSAALTDIPGLDSTLADKLQAAGIHTVADLAASDPVAVAEATGLPVGQVMLEDWIGKAQRLLS